MLLLKFYQYTRYYEMPQKACERGFCHVIAFSQFFRNTQLFLSDSENRKNGAFQKIENMLSHDKILFHMLFGALNDTPCNN